MNAPTVQFERLTGSRNTVRMNSIKTDTNMAVKSADAGRLFETSFPKMEPAMLLPPTTKPVNTPARVRKRARL